MMEPTILRTRKEILAERKAKREELQRFITNEERKIPAAEARIRDLIAETDRLQRQVAVLRRYADAGDSESALRLPGVRERLTSAVNQRQSWGGAIVDVRKRISDFKAEIARMDGERIDAPEDRRELDDVLAEIDGERREQEQVRVSKMAEVRQSIGNALSGALPDWAKAK